MGFEEQFCFDICGGKDQKRLWAGKVILSFNLSGKGLRNGERYVFMEHMECSDSLDNFD